MREIRPSGSEGGVRLIPHHYLYPIPCPRGGGGRVATGCPLAMHAHQAFEGGQRVGLCPLLSRGKSGAPRANLQRGIALRWGAISFIRSILRPLLQEWAWGG